MVSKKIKGEERKQIVKWSFWHVAMHMVTGIVTLYCSERRTNQINRPLKSSLVMRRERFILDLYRLFIDKHRRCHLYTVCSYYCVDGKHVTKLR